MSSKIDPDPSSKVSRRPAAVPPQAPVPPKPSAQASSPKAPPKPVLPPTVAEPLEQDHDQDQPAQSVRRGVLTQVPAWAISMVLHIIVLLAMALIAGEGPRTENPTVITSRGSEEEEEFVDLEDPQDTPQENSEEVTEPVADVAVTVDLAVTPIDVATVPDNTEAAPASFDLVEIGDQSAMASELGDTSGASGAGLGKGFGSRKGFGAAATKGGGGKDTEDAVDRALKWFIDHQLPDGGWSFRLTDCPSCGKQCSSTGTNGDRCAATGLALLPFLGRGYTHREGPHKKQVEAGIRFLVNMVIEGKGKAYAKGGSMYSQGVAGIVLSECYALSKDEQLAAPTQAVLDFIMKAQDPGGGGWGYEPWGAGPPDRTRGDTSQLSWQITALKSGYMAGLAVNPVNTKKAMEFLDSVQIDDSGASYKYTSSLGTPAMSAVGLLCRMYMGWKKDHPGIQEGAAIIAKRGPTDDLYYNYYATQIMHHMGGDMWIAWNTRMKGVLLKAQATKGHETGSWYKGVGGGHSIKAEGRLYCTSMSALILEVYYRHLPIYADESVEEEFRE